MSTNFTDLNPKESSEATIAANRKGVDRSLRTLVLEMEHENTLVQETPNGRLQKVLKIWRGVKPVFTVLASLPLIPSTWRAGIVIFSQALDSLSAIGGEITAQFKAGKDL